MYDKTSGAQFKKYGDIYDEAKNLSSDKLISKNIVTSDKVISSLYHFSETVFIEINQGMAAILISESSNGNFKVFAIHRHLLIKANMYFNIIPMTDQTSFNLIIPTNYNLNVDFLSSPYVYNRILRTINIPEIVAYYYTIKSPNYHFKGEKHNLYELTFVDNGILDTAIDGTSYTLNPYDLIIYGKNQFHSQSVNNDSSCSYITVMFDMKCDDDSSICNRVFHCRKELYKTVKHFIQNLTCTLPFSDNLILNSFHEVIIRLFQYNYLDAEYAKLSTESQNRFEDELLQKIIDYIDKNICEPISVEEICSKFLVSRSSLQLLFKNNINTSPKKYINDLKLAKSKQLIRENKYTISEIAFMLGFSSIHYFSRAFTQHYEISPSEYSQKVFKS